MMVYDIAKGTIKLIFLIPIYIIEGFANIGSDKYTHYEFFEKWLSW